MKTTIIHHSADFDGIFCREIAKKFLPDAELIGWDYGQSKIPFPDGDKVYVMDLSPDCFEEATMPNPDEQKNLLIWIDHHKSAIDKWASTTPGYRIDGVAACRLAWQWFTLHLPENNLTSWSDLRPSKQDFIDRKVSEPIAVRLAGEYDIWDKRDPNAEVLQMGLRSMPAQLLDWAALLAPNAGLYIDSLLSKGHLIQDYQRQQDSFAMQNSFLVKWEGLNFLALNTQAKSSLAFMSQDVPETGHDALLKFSFNGKIWDCSMYHAKHNTGIDLSQIAVKYGGGGHRGACGFRVGKLPFL
jgi:oligoribonuclease NrnB/cAMP/cGMP phosphodiesterase (DHH superfamily)